MSNLKPSKKTIENLRFKDKEWYVSLAADVLDLKFASLAKNLGKGLNPTVKDTSKELLNLYLHAMESVLKDLEISFILSAENISEHSFSDSIIEPNFPSYHPVFNELIKQLEYEYIKQENTPFNGSWLDFKNLIRNEFSIAFNSIISSTLPEYSNAINYINNLKAYSEPTESKVINHMNMVIDELENDSLAIDPDLTLRKSYVTPSCVRTLKVIHKQDGEKKKHENLIQAILSDIKASTSPIVIHGQPGHGKTSSVKVLVNALAKTFQANDKQLSVLFYEFKNLRNLNDSIIQILSSETSFVKDETFFENKSTVLILDGLDERQLADGSDEVLKGFVSGLFRLSDKINSIAGSQLNIVLTGRSQYVGQIKSCFNLDHIIYEIEDFSKDKIEQWLERFNSQKQSKYASHNTITFKQLNKYHLQELMSQPILLSISSIMLCDPDGLKLLSKFENSTINRTQIYKVIIQWSYEKRWQKSPSIPSINSELNFDEYLSLLQAIAFEMFKNGEENIKVSTLASALQTSIFDLDFIKNKDVTTIERLCSQLRISFFFKGVEDKAFSFLHKSIKDFLIVSAILDGAISLLENCNIKKIDREAPELYSLFGSGRLSSEDHIPMLVEWLGEKQSDLIPHNKKLLTLWERISLNNLPIQFDTPDIVFVNHNNVLSNFYQLLSRHLSSLDKATVSDLFSDGRYCLFALEGDTAFNSQPREEKFITLKSFINLTIEHNAVANQYSFKNQKLSGGGLYDSFPSLMIGHDFSNCNFAEISFNKSEFIKCNFHGASFKFCWLSSAKFSKCDFSNSHMDCLSLMVKDDEYPRKLCFYNIFDNCNFRNSELSGGEVGISIGGDGRQYLFWNCDFESATFTDRQYSTIEYSDDFDGSKLGDI